MKGFRTFLFRGNVIDLAVAVVMGVAFNAIVQALVKYIITPLIAAAGGTPNFSALKVGIGSTTIDYGLLLNAVISFARHRGRGLLPDRRAGGQGHGVQRAQEGSHRAAVP